MYLPVPEVGAHRPPRKDVRHIVIRAGIIAAFLTFPGIKGSAQAIFPRFGARAIQGIDAVAHQRLGDFRQGGQIEIEHEHLCIPEYGAFVGLAGKTARRDGQAAAMARRDGQQLIGGIADRMLGLGVPVDRDIGGLPQLLPTGGMCIQ